jgi:hypothetical protein
MDVVERFRGSRRSMPVLGKVLVFPTDSVMCSICRQAEGLMTRAENLSKERAAGESVCSRTQSPPAKRVTVEIIEKRNIPMGVPVW